MTRKEICDFWIGTFESSSDYFDFLGEDPEFYKNEEIDITEIHLQIYEIARRELD